MKRKAIMLFMVLAMLFVTIPSVTYAGEQDFTLVNNTGGAITELYIAPSKSKDWGYDLLNGRTIPNGGSMNITFKPGTRSTYWDISVKYKNGEEAEWTGDSGNFNLKEIEKITLKPNNYAEYE